MGRAKRQWHAKRLKVLPASPRRRDSAPPHRASTTGRLAGLRHREPSRNSQFTGGHIWGCRPNLSVTAPRPSHTPGHRCEQTGKCIIHGIKPGAPFRSVNTCHMSLHSTVVIVLIYVTHNRPISLSHKNWLRNPSRTTHHYYDSWLAQKEDCHMCTYKCIDCLRIT